jgi:hypothetical protein
MSSLLGMSTTGGCRYSWKRSKLWRRKRNLTPLPVVELDMIGAALIYKELLSAGSSRGEVSENTPLERLDDEFGAGGGDQPSCGNVDCDAVLEEVDETGVNAEAIRSPGSDRPAAAGELDDLDIGISRLGLHLWGLVVRRQLVACSAECLLRQRGPLQALWPWPHPGAFEE